MRKGWIPTNRVRFRKLPGHCDSSNCLQPKLSCAPKNMNIELKELSQGPIYAQVREQIESQIRERTVASGETLPTPAAPAQKLAVDKGEIQRAYFELERSEERRVGK